jgi:hypothetical protein
MKLLIRSIILFLVVLFLPVQCQNSSEKVVQGALQKLYDTCEHAGYFSDAHLKKASIDFTRIAQSVDDGYATLQLIEWLEKHQDSKNKIALAAINELCYSEFIRILSVLKEGDLVIEKFQYLADKEIIIDGIASQPFRTPLSKMLLMIALVKSQKLSNVRQKELLALSLSKIKNEMLNINKQLGMDKVQECEIREVCSVLQLHAIPAIVPQSSFISKKFVIITALLIIITVIVVYYAPPLVDKLKTYIDEVILPGFDGYLQRSSRSFAGAYKTFFDEFVRVTAANLSAPLRKAFFRWGAENQEPAPADASSSSSSSAARGVEGPPVDTVAVLNAL